MANPKHVRILKQGFPAWNWWRSEKKEIPDLTGMANVEHLRIPKKNVRMWNRWRTKTGEQSRSHAKLKDADLIGANLIGASLSRANLIDARLENANLSNADLCHAHLHNADLRSANIKNANLTNADLDDADLCDADLRGARLCGARLRGSDLSHTNFGNANLKGADLTGANLSHAGFVNANLQDADLTGAKLSSALFDSADLSGAKLSSANLNSAYLHSANLSGADLNGADLSGADLTDTIFSSTDLKDANLEKARVWSTKFENCDLSEVRGLNMVKHGGLSHISIDTIYKSKGKISEEFLRGCGVPENLIRYIPSLVNSEDGIQFYSCFISYSGGDDEFARRLHGRMRDAHLRVWFGPEEMKGGNLLIEQIEAAIRVYDKLLIVLSEASMKSEWVMTELRKARKAERQSGKRKLFPVRLMDMNKLKAWECLDADSGKDLAVELREYFIPDFSNWEDHDQFEAAFARLLKDLRAEERAK